MSIDIPLFKVFMSEDVIEPVNKVLRSGYIGQGPIVEDFEKDLMSWMRTHSQPNDAPIGLATTNSGTAAEHLALHLLKKPEPELNWPGLNPGDEVLATPLTCTASNWPILANNLKIKWVDVDKNNLCMDLDDLARKITPTTKAVMLVHWGGYPADLNKIKQIQDDTETKFGFRPMIIEDCAHSLGSTFEGTKLGNHGNIATFSFQAIKHMTSVDGGLLISPFDEFNRRAKLLRWYGIERNNTRKDFRCESDIPEWGFKFHMNDVNAAIGQANLKHIDFIINKHRDNAEFYNQNLKDISGITLLENKPNRESASWLYTFRVERRDDFMAKMAKAGIMVSRVHERNDKHSCVDEFKAHLPNLEVVSKDMICIPVGWWIESEQREYIIDSIKSGW